MTLPLYIGTIPGEGTGLQVLAYLNNGFAAAFSQSASPTAPENPVGWMQWGNSATGVAYVRDPQNVAWVPVGRFEAQSWVPFVASGTTGGQETGDSTSLGPYASLAAGEGFAAGHAGVASVRTIVASDLPTVSATAAGIAPTPTATQAGNVLRPTGWTQLLQNLGVRLLNGATSYVWSGFAACSGYRFAYDLTLSGAQPAMVQIGSDGAPRTSGYATVTNRNVEVDDQIQRTEGVQLWYARPTAGRVLGSLDVMEMEPNTYLISGSSTVVTSDYVDTFRGIVSLSGPMNYLRILTIGSPAYSFAAQHTLVSGRAKLFGM